MAEDLIRLCAGTGGAFVALIFLRAAIHKAADLPRFAGVLADYDLLPGSLAPAIARLTPVLEVAAAAALVLEPTRVLGALGAALLLLIYALAMGINLARGRIEIDCGCGGPPEMLSWRLVARNAVLTALVAPSLLGLGAGLSGGETGAVWAIAILAFVLWGAAEQLLANAGRMADDRRHALVSSFGGAQ